MALQSKTITGNGSKGHHKFTLTVTADFNDKNGSITITGIFQISAIQPGWNWSSQGTNISYTVKANGLTFAKGTIPDYDGSSTVTLVNKSYNYDLHEEKIDLSFTVTDRDGLRYTCGSASASGTLILDYVGLVYIDNGSGWDAYQVYIDNGSSWDRYIPYIDNGSGWDMY